MAVVTTNLGTVTAYGDAVAAGYTGTKAQWQALMADYATVGTQAAQDAQTASTAAQNASTAAQTATTKANEASQSAQAAQDAADAIGTPDTTLTQAGKAADAKATGDEISELKSGLSDLNADLSAIAPEMTTFVKKLSHDKAATTFEQIDPNYVTYEGMVFAREGTFTENSNFNSYAFVCPYDGMELTTNVHRVCICSTFPTDHVDIVAVLKYGTDTVETITIPHKGDIVVLSLAVSAKLLLLTMVSVPTNIDTLFLKESHDRFMLQAVSDSGVSDIGNDKLNIVKVAGQLAVTTTGGYDSNASYTSWYFRVPVPTLTIKCTNGFRAVIGYNEPSTTSQSSNLKSLVYAYASGRVDTFTASYGDWVIISVPNSAGDIALETSYTTRFTLPALRLGYRQLDSFYKYTVNTDGKRLFIYYKSGNKYVRWELHNIPSTGINSDTWQLGRVCGLDEDLTNEVELVTGGEFELALKEHGAADFCGGNNHGDEKTDTFLLYIDGKKLSDLTASSNEYIPFNRIDAIEIATVNRCDTPYANIATHQKAWTFEGGKVNVHQSLTFLDNLQIDGMLICMLAANRSAFQYGIRQGRTGIETMTDNSYNIIRTKINDMFYEMYGDNATAKIIANSHNDDGDSGLWINPTSVLNKLYFTYWESSNSVFPVSVNANTTLHWESEYDIAYN